MSRKRGTGDGWIPRVCRTTGARSAGVYRDEMLDGLIGVVVDIGVGKGRNFVHYPHGVTEVLAVEPKPRSRHLAAAAAKRASVPVTVLHGTADTLPLEDGSVDAAVCSLVLCSVPNQATALAEVHRVLRPGGELRFYEHVVDWNSPQFARFQRAVDVIHPFLSAGCHLTRDTLAAIVAAGFEVVSVRRFRFSPTPFARAAAPKILGCATKPI